MGGRGRFFNADEVRAVIIAVASLAFIVVLNSTDLNANERSCESNILFRSGK